MMLRSFSLSYVLLFSYCCYSSSSSSSISLEEVLQASGFSNADILQIKNEGKMLRSTVESTTDLELAVKFAFTIDTPVESLSELFLKSLHKKEDDPQVLELGHFSSSDGSIKDLAQLSLFNDKLTQTYLNAAPGSDLNLHSDEIESLKALSSNSTKVSKKELEQHIREMLLQRYRSYRQKGLAAGVPTYARANDKNYDPAQELLLKTKLSKVLKDYAPPFYKYLVEYPNHKPDNLQETFSWTNSKIDDKPTFALVHKVGMMHEGVYFHCERHYFVSRSHNSFQGIGGAFPLENGGTVILWVARTSTDQVSGFGGATKRGIGARIMGSTMAKIFESQRTRVHREL